MFYIDLCVAALRDRCYEVVVESSHFLHVTLVTVKSETVDKVSFVT